MKTKIAEQKTQDTEIEDAAASLTQHFEDCFQLLVNRRNAARDAGYKPLDEEIMHLAEESGTIEDDLRNLEGLLESKVRVAQHEADELRLAGQHGEAEERLEEMRAAQQAPEAMRARQQELEQRAQAIEEEKRKIDERTLSTFFEEAKPLIRAGEGLFFLLDRVEAYLQQETPGYVSNNLLNALTSDEGGAAWRSGQKWYRGRR
jgi:anthranilate/para-aminobenzoate synthase component I